MLSHRDDNSEECSGGLVLGGVSVSPDLPDFLCLWQLVLSRVLERFPDRGTGRMADGWLHSTFPYCIRL